MDPSQAAMPPANHTQSMQSEAQTPLANIDSFINKLDRKEIRTQAIKEGYEERILLLKQARKDARILMHLIHKYTQSEPLSPAEWSALRYKSRALKVASDDVERARKVTSGTTDMIQQTVALVSKHSSDEISKQLAVSSLFDDHRANEVDASHVQQVLTELMDKVLKFLCDTVIYSILGWSESFKTEQTLKFRAWLDLGAAALGEGSALLWLEFGVVTLAEEAFERVLPEVEAAVERVANGTLSLKPLVSYPDSDDKD